MDIEWALADGKFAILQARPITALPAEPRAAIEWKRPNPKGQYMRGSVVDLLPDPVSPLFATLAIPAVAQVGIKQVLGPLTRSEPDLPGDYITTINDYALHGNHLHAASVVVDSHPHDALFPAYPAPGPAALAR